MLIGGRRHSETLGPNQATVAGQHGFSHTTEQELLKESQERQKERETALGDRFNHGIYQAIIGWRRMSQEIVAEMAWRREALQRIENDIETAKITLATS